MMQFAEADPTQATAIASSMMKFVTLAHSMLVNNGTGVEEWGAARWQDFALVVQWCVGTYHVTSNAHQIQGSTTTIRTGNRACFWIR
jgi:hypothetical protein